ncbi:hypothetical protein IWW34DRAFT_838784 [Fusarium oxysporum f. sp. albedinis]|nr:hypothetical protein IWW34DRAFT_838784 [Fusarium oxysporum f. sp. albedinis]KAK2468808.1 hypothetical protein H9L39_19570 [Fusarium oxysporum f. sp. albedinis]
MAAYCFESNAQDVLCDDPVEYCSCVVMVDNHGRCGICDRLCPDEKAIYLALRDIELICELGRKWAKKTKHHSGTIKRTLASIEDRPDVKVLVDQYGMDTLQSVVKRLLKNGVFTSERIAQKRFPGLTIAIGEEETMSTEPAEVTQEKSDWEILVAAEAPEEASVEIPDEEPAKASEEESSIEEALEEACGDCAQKEQNTICLPFSSQHKLIVHLQEVLEGACFAYGRRNLAGLLRERGWDCVESVPLTTWMNELMDLQQTSDRQLSRGLLQSIAEIQDIAFKRTRIGWSRMKKFLDDAVELTEILEAKEYGEIITQVRLDIGKTIEGLSREEQEAQRQGEKKLQLIAEERRKLDEREAEIRNDEEKRIKECQRSAESEVKKVLDEGNQALERAAFFLSLETKES